MFGKPFVSPKNSTPKSLASTSDFGKSPKMRDSYLRSTPINKVKHNGLLEHRESFYTKESSQLDNESLLSTQIGSNSNIGFELQPSLSIITEVAGGGRDVISNTLFNEKYCRKVLEEMHGLRQELEQKNDIINRLTKENDNLRREMEEFLTAVDDAREYIDVELKECNKRIQDLEAEIYEVREENKQYKRELEKRDGMLSEASDKKEIAKLLQQEVDGFHAISQKDTEDFYFQLNEQIADFLNTSKEKYQDFTKNLQSKLQNTKKEAIVKVEPTKANKSISGRNSPLRNVKQNPSRGRIQSPKASQSVSLAKKSSKKNLDNFLSLTNEISSPSSYGLYNISPGHASISQFDKQYEDLGVPFLNDFDKSKRNSYLASPSKSSLLRTKLKSDAILLEMKKKLAGL